MSIRPRQSLLNPKLQRPSALSSIPRSSEYLWLDKNENLDPVLLAISRKILLETSPLVLATYPEAGEAYRKLADWVGVTPDHLLLTPGSDGAIRLVFEAFVEHGDGVIHTFPTFAMYPVYSQMFGARAFPIDYERRGDVPRLDTDKIIATLRERKPKVLCLPNPDSPTGTIVEPTVLRQILEACEAADTVLLLDEAYHPFYDWSAVSWTETSRNLVIARTFAKAWGIAGLRVGYAVAHPDTISLLHKMRPMYEVSTLAAEFVAKILDHVSDLKDSVARNNAGKKYFYEEMRSLGFNVLPTLSNFAHVAFGEREHEIRAALSRKVLYRPSFDHPSLIGYSRFTVAPRGIMEQVVDVIKGVMEKKS